ncbi:hypothetical protein CANCADRAFT_66366 [Tortispora caseinolytica NRRL Y-17796]|uniref:Uncharacterized protein n=1 Tax=Tortispora caseinolytica NRRL Y-17796 TaxID=767744 RepID=A0A1E4T9S4_9ASCO|nr:hypothetical protein CANCADRAFT_66366 [Tortispora caseinolytica NRRL Y-17796]
MLLSKFIDLVCTLQSAEKRNKNLLPVLYYNAYISSTSSSSKIENLLVSASMFYWSASNATMIQSAIQLRLSH